MGDQENRLIEHLTWNSLDEAYVLTYWKNGLCYKVFPKPKRERVEND